MTEARVPPSGRRRFVAERWASGEAVASHPDRADTPGWEEAALRLLQVAARVLAQTRNAIDTTTSITLAAVWAHPSPALSPIPAPGLAGPRRGPHIGGRMALASKNRHEGVHEDAGS